VRTLKPRRATRFASHKRKAVVRIVRSRDQLEVWLCKNGKPETLTGTVNTTLAVDATRYGQDLIEELIERALWESDRRSIVSSRPHSRSFGVEYGN
jgi:hypothetical protein